MKSTVFELKFPHVAPDWSNEMDVKFPIPTLSAYAIEYAEFSCRGGFNDFKEMIEGTDFELIEDGLLWHSAFEPKFPGMDYYRLVIHYHGIKDYALLFPHVRTPELRNRLGEFYREAELNFESGAWLSFSLMCGAIYEGMLLDNFGSMEAKFSELISKGKHVGILDEFSVKTINRTRELRNLVHPGRVGEKFITRSDAMEMRTVLDRLIKKAGDWPQGKHVEHT